VRPDSPAAEPHVRGVSQRFLAAGITPEDMAPEKWKVLTRPLREPSPRRAAARKRRSNATPEPASMSGIESSGITARTEKIVQQRLEIAPEEELFFAIAYGQITHEKAREPLIQRGLVREKHRDAVRSGSVAVGMSDLEVVLSQGRVADIHTVKEPSGVRRQLIYREPDSLVTTENGFVTSWNPTLPDRWNLVRPWRSGVGLGLTRFSGHLCMRQDPQQRHRITPAIVGRRVSSRDSARSGPCWTIPSDSAARLKSP
jgi:hypothetical protein